MKLKIILWEISNHIKGQMIFYICLEFILEFRVNFKVIINVSKEREIFTNNLSAVKSIAWLRRDVEGCKSDKYIYN